MKGTMNGERWGLIWTDSLWRKIFKVMEEHCIFYTLQKNTSNAFNCASRSKIKEFWRHQIKVVRNEKPSQKVSKQGRKSIASQNLFISISFGHFRKETQGKGRMCYILSILNAHIYFIGHPRNTSEIMSPFFRLLIPKENLLKGGHPSLLDKLFLKRQLQWGRPSS